VSVDMGGTSYDVGLVRGGQPEIATFWNWRHRYYVDIPMVDVTAVGAGGGSIATVRAGALLVGPESAGAVPGPACYGFGGERATVLRARLARRGLRGRLVPRLRLTPCRRGSVADAPAARRTRR